MNILDDFPKQESTPSQKNPIITLMLFIFTGFWLYHWNPKLKRKKLYVVAFWYPWLNFMNIILVCDYHTGIKFLEQFHNHNSIGAMLLFAAWIFYYFIGFIDWALQMKKSQLL